MKSSPKIIDKILESIRAYESFCIVGHIRPDGDCIGSQLGLGLALRNAGKKVKIWNENEVPHKLRFLDPQKLVRQPKAAQPFDCVIATDCATYDRLGSVGAFIQNRKLLINIDHHESNERYGDINWVSSLQPATGELIFLLLKAANWKITDLIADCLFTAISTDTGSVQYPSTRPSTYQAAAELVSSGARLATISQEVYQSYSLSRIRLVKHVYNNFRLIEQNQIAYFWLKKSDFKRTGADSEDSEGLVDHVRAIEPVVVACVFEEMEPELTRVSLRSKSQAINVSTIASQFEGGGHPAAAGARISGRPLQVQRRVINAIKKALRETE